jgi:hypothetical protein
LSLSVAVIEPETVEVTGPLHVPAALTGAGSAAVVDELLLLPPQPEKADERTKNERIENALKFMGKPLL